MGSTHKNSGCRWKRLGYVELRNAHFTIGFPDKNQPEKKGENTYPPKKLFF